MNATNGHQANGKAAAGKSPPHSPELELAVLGCGVLDHTRIAEISAIISPDDFYDRVHGEIFRLLVAMVDNGEPIDGLTLIDRAATTEFDTTRSLLQAFGGETAMFDLLNREPQAAHAAYYAKQVKERSQLRRQGEIFEQALAATFEPKADANAILTKVLERLETVRPAAEADEFPMLTASELDGSNYKLDYLIPGIMTAGQPAVVGGGFKTLKTSIIEDMAISLATGGCFLGKFRVSRRCNVAIFSGESGLPTIQATCRSIAAAAGVNLSDIDGLFFSDALPQLSNPKHVAAVERFIEQNRIDVVFLDPLYLSLATGGGEASIYAMGALLRPLADLAAATGVTPVVVHHLKRNRPDAYAVPELGDLAFSGIAEFARQWLLLGRREKYEPGTGQHRLWLSVGGSAGHSGCWAVDVDEGAYQHDVDRYWSVSVTAADEARQGAASRDAEAKERSKADKIAAQLERDKKAVIDALAKCPQHTGTLSDIKDRCKRNGQAFKAAFAEALDDGSIVDAGMITKGNNRAYQSYTLGGSNDA